MLIKPHVHYALPLLLIVLLALVILSVLSVNLPMTLVLKPQHTILFHQELVLLVLLVARHVQALLLVIAQSANMDTVKQQLHA